MPAIDYSIHGYTMPAPHRAASAPETAPAAPQPDEGGGGFDLSFDNLLDIVNPLQHLPVIGTLYRAITGDQIHAPERIAGDALYGGLWGLIGSVADTAFEAITGKTAGDTVLALFTGDDEAAPDMAVAANAPAQVEPVQVEPAQNVTPGFSALSGMLAEKQIDPALASRALMAYGRTMEQAASGALAP